MRYAYQVKNSGSSILLSLLISFCILSTSYAAEGGVKESDFIGVWTGTVSTPLRENPVDLSIKATEGTSSTISYSFHYGPTRSCRLNAVKVIQESNVLSLVFDEASGGYCDQLWRANMTLELLDSKQLSVTIHDPESDIRQETVLKKQE